MASQIEFISNVIQELKNNAELMKRVDFFGTQEIARWENWLQMELLFALDERGADYWWEDGFTFHGKKKTELLDPKKMGAKIDITFRQKGADSGVYTAVELKAKPYPDKSIGEAMKDLLRINLLEHTDFRAIYAIAAYLPLTDSAYEELVTEIGGKIINFGNEWKLAIFGWEGAPRSEDLSKDYAIWCSDLVAAAKKFPRIKNKTLK